MQINVIENAGFCFGVSRAVDMAYAAAKNRSDNIYMLGQIIHNPKVVGDLVMSGVKIVDSIDEISPDSVVIARAHGITLDERYKLESKNIKIIDTTCPFVAKTQQIVKKASDAGDIILIGGDKNHPEVKSIKSYSSSQTYVFKDNNELLKLFETIDIDTKKQVSAVWQTTFNILEFELCKKNIKKLFENSKVYDTICNATEKRQAQTKELAQKSDAMIIIGGKNSSNTNKLYDIAKSYCKDTFFAESIDEIPIELIYKKQNIGIAAGASTPVRMIEEVKGIMSEQTNEAVVNNEEAVVNQQADKPAAETTVDQAQENAEKSFEEMLEDSLKSVISNGDIVKGVVVGINPAEIKVDLGTKQSGFITRDNFSSDPDVDMEKAVKIGDEIECIVLRVNDVEGTIALSKKRVDAMAGMKALEQAYENKEAVDGVVSEVTNGGLVVKAKGARVFIPKSLTARGADFDFNTLLNQPVQFNIIEIYQARGRKKIVGSMRAIENEKRRQRRKEFWEAVEPGKHYLGKVKSLTSFGAFIDLGGVDGLLHITEISWKRISHPSDVLKEGDEIEVFVKSVDKENKKISLGYKKPEDNPFVIFRKDHEVGDVVKAKIVSLMPFGAFANIADGVDGLIHISQISNQRIAKPHDVLKVGDEVDVKILDINNETGKIGLSIKALLEQKEKDDDTEIPPEYKA